MENLPECNEEFCDCRIIHEERIAAAREQLLAEREIEGLSGLFKAMGDPTRVKILWSLGRGEMCVCDLAAFLGLTESAVSHQLRLLRQLQLVSNRRQGPVLYYRLNDDHVGQLLHVALEHVRE
ncbi:MAG: metalloregulator ArsR/SmtB family transcription factor [Thermodesulfobacteriota bacterium]